MSSISTTEVFQVNHTAVITGGSSGIGRTVALECALKGMHVWLVDIDEDDLKKTEQDIQLKVKGSFPDQVIQAIVANVGDEVSMKSVAKSVYDDQSTKSVHFLMNNAAMSIGGGAIETSMTDFDTMMKTNLYGPIHGCQAFLPIMKERQQPGIIVNTGSKQGITMPPGNLTYNVSKAALKTWTEGLEHELMMDRVTKGGKLRSALLVPGWVNTSIKVKELRDRAITTNDKEFDYEQVKKVTSHENNPADGAWMPKQVFDYMVNKLDKGSFYIVCPDNEVDSETDKARMTWAMMDITEDRPPLSRWNPEWKGEFDNFLKSQKK